MALEALSAFASMLSGGSSVSNSVNVSVSSAGTQSQFQTINPTTALLYQTIEVLFVAIIFYQHQAGSLKDPLPIISINIPSHYYIYYYY